MNGIVCTFDLTNALNFFQRVMNFVLLLAKDFAAIYLNDVLLHSKTLQEAFAHFQKVLELFRTVGLTLNLEKCVFFSSSINFLGFEIGSGTVRPGVKKYTAIHKASSLLDVSRGNF